MCSESLQFKPYLVLFNQVILNFLKFFFVTIPLINMMNRGYPGRRSLPNMSNHDLFGFPITNQQSPMMNQSPLMNQRSPMMNQRSPMMNQQQYGYQQR